MARDADDPPENDAPPPAAISTKTAPLPGRPFAAGQSGNPTGRPKLLKEFRDMARGFAGPAMQKLFTLALRGQGMVAVRACEIIIERAWGKTPLEVSGPKGAPLDTRFYGAARQAIEEAIAKAAAEEARVKAESPGPKN